MHPKVQKEKRRCKSICPGLPLHQERIHRHTLSLPHIWTLAWCDPIVTLRIQMDSEPNPLNLSCSPSPQHGQREITSLCGSHCRHVPRVLSTAGIVQWRLEPSWMSSCGSQHHLGIVAQGHLQVLLCRSIYEWSRCMWRTFFLHDIWPGGEISMHKKYWTFPWGGSS